MILWNVLEGEKIGTFQSSFPVYALAFNRDGRQLAAGGHDKNVVLWDTRTGEIAKTFKGHRDDVLALALSPDGKTLASGGEDEAVMLWDTGKGESIGTLKKHTSTIQSLAFSRDGAMLVSGGRDRLIVQWDVENKQEMRTLTGHQALIYSVSLRPDGVMMASGGHDGSLVIWDVVETLPFRKKESESQKKFEERVRHEQVPYSSAVTLDRYDRRKQAFVTNIAGTSVLMGAPKEYLKKIKKERGTPAAALHG